MIINPVLRVSSHLQSSNVFHPFPSPVSFLAQRSHSLLSNYIDYGHSFPSLYVCVYLSFTLSGARAPLALASHSFSLYLASLACEIGGAQARSFPSTHTGTHSHDTATLASMLNSHRQILMTTMMIARSKLEKRSTTESKLVDLEVSIWWKRTMAHRRRPDERACGCDVA